MDTDSHTAPSLLAQPEPIGGRPVQRVTQATLSGMAQPPQPQQQVTQIIDTTAWPLHSDVYRLYIDMPTTATPSLCPGYTGIPDTQPFAPPEPTSPLLRLDHVPFLVCQRCQ